MGKIYFPDPLKSVFEEIESRIRETLHPEYILLAGSFSKNSWLYDGHRLLSDIEIVFVCSSKWSKEKKKILVRELNDEFPYKIELKGFLRSGIEKKILSNYSFSNPGYLSLNFYDVFSEPKYLYQTQVDPLDLKLNVGEIPSWEAWRLYVNRMADLIKMNHGDLVKEQEQHYYWMKMFEATADSYLIVKNLYQKEIERRRDIFSKDLLESDSELSEVCKDSWPIIHKALISRAEHNLSKFDMSSEPKKLRQIVRSWMTFFEKKVASDEGLIYENKKQFYLEYLNSEKLQRKYLDVTDGFNIVLANTLKLIGNISLLKGGFKWYAIQKSWRHHILVIMACIFEEETAGDKHMELSRKLAKKIFKTDHINKMNSSEFIDEMTRHWQLVR